MRVEPSIGGHDRIPTFTVIRSDATIEFGFADWETYEPATGWTFELVGLAPGEPRHVLVKRFRDDRVILVVTDLDSPV